MSLFGNDRKATIGKQHCIETPSRASFETEVAKRGVAIGNPQALSTPS